jgi:hypothetical protein
MTLSSDRTASIPSATSAAMATPVTAASTRVPAGMPAGKCRHCDGRDGRLAGCPSWAGPAGAGQVLVAWR